MDPLDGTKEFLKRNGEFTVNIALVTNGMPVLGVVHVPCQAKTYVSVHARGMCFALKPCGKHLEHVFCTMNACSGHVSAPNCEYMRACPMHARTHAQPRARAQACRCVLQQQSAGWGVGASAVLCLSCPWAVCVGCSQC